MKKFEIPEIKFINFAVEDIITTSSGEQPDAGENGMGWA